MHKPSSSWIEACFSESIEIHGYLLLMAFYGLEFLCVNALWVVQKKEVLIIW